MKYKAKRKTRNKTKRFILEEYKRICQALEFIDIKYRFLKSDYERTKNKYEKLKARFDRLGNICETAKAGRPIHGIEVQEELIAPEAYGVNISFSENTFFDLLMENYKNDIAVQIANKMIEDNMIQFIIKGKEDGNSPLSMGVLACKAYVIPWDVMVSGKRIKVRTIKGIYIDELINRRIQVNKMEEP